MLLIFSDIHQIIERLLLFNIFVIELLLCLINKANTKRKGRLFFMAISLFFAS